MENEELRMKNSEFRIQNEKPDEAEPSTQRQLCVSAHPDPNSQVSILNSQFRIAIHVLVTRP